MTNAWGGFCGGHPSTIIAGEELDAIVRPMYNRPRTSFLYWRRA
jgi:hypothetical protein